MSNIVWIQDNYSDTLLALGIAAAYNVPCQNRGSLFWFPEGDVAPLPFPESTEEEPDPPVSYSIHQDYTINSLKGLKNMNKLRETWNSLLPRYGEIWALMQPGFEDWQQTRFWNTANKWSTAATFRPQGAKSEDVGGATTSREFWLLDALRAFGWVIFARSYRLNKENALNRYLVAIPSEPVLMGSLYSAECKSVALLRIYLAAAQARIRRVEIAQYAELNPFSKTVWGQYTMMIPELPENVRENLSFILSDFTQYYSISEQVRYSQPILDTIEGRIHLQDLADVIHCYNMEAVMSPMALHQFLIPTVEALLCL